MPNVPPPPDYYLVIPVNDNPGADRADMTDQEMPAGVHAALLAYIVEGRSEEEVIAKVAPIVPGAARFFAIVAPTFPRPA